MVSPSSFLDQCVSSAVAARSNATTTTEPATARSFSAVSFNENAHFIRLSLDLPGVLQQDLSVEMQRGVLMIRGMRETPLLQNGVRHQHTFCRRFAIDTDVVDSTKLRANLNRRGILTVMAPKKSLPTVQSVSVTEQDDEEWEQIIMKSYVEEKALLMAMSKREETNKAEEEEEEAQEEEETVMTEDEEVPVEELIRTEIEQAVPEEKTPVVATTTAAATTAAPLPNVVSMGSTLDILAYAASQGANVRRTHKSSLQSHLMMRRSQHSVSP